MTTLETEKSDVKKKKLGGARENAGRKAFTPTKNEQKQVEIMSGHGVPHEQIAISIRDGICADTLVKYFSKELTVGKARANAQVGKTLFQKALGGDVTAMIWWTKTQMRWTDTRRLEHTSPDDSLASRSALDVSKLSDATLREIIAAKRGRDSSAPEDE